MTTTRFRAFLARVVARMMTLLSALFPRGRAARRVFAVALVLGALGGGPAVAAEPVGLDECAFSEGVAGVPGESEKDPIAELPQPWVSPYSDLRDQEHIATDVAACAYYCVLMQDGTFDTCRERTLP